MQERLSIKSEGFNAIYFQGTIYPEKVIICVGGASCDEKTSIVMSRYLRNAGYNVLVLGFYMWKGMSKNLVSIPVDYVENAIIWLKTKKHIEKICITGISTGAGYALLCASLFPQISGVIPVVPFDYVMEGTTNSFKRLGKSVYTFHGKDLPFSRWSILDNGFMKVVSSARKDKNYGLGRFMRYGYDNNPLNEESRIRIENMKADVLFIAAKDDDAWPSDLAVMRMTKILKNCNYSYKVESHIYEKASHALSDGLDDLSGYARWAFKHMLPAEKKYPKECEEARQDSLKRILKFLDEWS